MNAMYTNRTLQMKLETAADLRRIKQRIIILGIKLLGLLFHSPPFKLQPSFDMC